MKTIGKMNTDSHLSHCKTGEVRLSKNMVIGKDKQSRVAELGEQRALMLSGLGIPNSKILGVIDCNNFNVLICTWNTTKLCVIKHTGDGYQIILKTKYIDIDVNEVVEGVFQINNLGQTIVAFWNGTQSTSMLPRLINIDELPFTVDSDKEIVGDGVLLAELTLLQLNRTEPTINPVVYRDEGTLRSGKYSFCINYVLDEDESSTTIPSKSVFVEDVEDIVIPELRSNFRGLHWYDDVLNNYQLAYRSSTPQSIVNAGIRVVITNLDTRYKKFHLNVIHFNSGEINTYRVKDLIIDGTYYEYNLSTLVDLSDIPLDNILQTSFTLDKIQSGDTFKNRLYVGGFVEKDYNYQPFANSITVKLGIRAKSYRGIESFVPDEAYAMYVHVLYKNGKLGKGCFISGRLPLGSELNSCDGVVYGDVSSQGATLNNASNFKEFHVNTSRDAGNIGFWENANYKYSEWLPENRKRYITDINGAIVDTNNDIDVTREYLRLIRFPDITQIAAIQDDYGSLGSPANQYEIYPIFENIHIPAELQTVAQGVVFSYAKKGSQDMHILGYGDGAILNWYNTYPLTTEFPILAATPVNTMELHIFDQLTIKNGVTPLCLKDIGRIGRYGYGDQYYINASPTNNNILPTQSVSYLPANNSAVGNGYKEEKQKCILKCNIDRTFGCNTNTVTFDRHGIVDDSDFVGYHNILKITILQQMHSFICMVSDNRDLHGNCLNAELVNMGIVKYFESNTYVYDTNGLIPKGDCYLEHDTVRLLWRQLWSGTLYDLQYMMERYPTYSRLPVEMRTYTDIPVPKIIQYFVEVTRIYYFNHYNMYHEGKILDTLRLPNIESLNVKRETNYTKYLIRSNIIDVDSVTVGWRNFIPLTSKDTPNFLVTDLDKGDILHIEFNNKALYIQTTNTLFMAGVQSKLTSQIALEETDVFTITPNEILISKDERIGCLHKTACRLTPAGYIVVNRNVNKIYIVTDGIVEILQEGVESLVGAYLQRSGYRSTINDNISIGYDLEYERVIFCFNNLYQNDTSVVLGTQPINLSDSSNTLFPLGGNSSLVENTFIPVIHNNEVYLGKIIYRNNSYFIDTDNLYDYYTMRDGSKKEQICFNYMKGLGWISYSTHRFNRILNDTNRVLGIKDDMLIRLNDKIEFGSLTNGEQYECFADFIFNLSTESLNSVISEVSVRTLLKDRYGVINPDLTFNAYMVYTENQCSGIIPLTKFTNSITNKLLTRVHDVWNINHFKDKVIDYTQSFMDKLGTVSNVDENMAWFKQGNFHNKVFVVRLIVTNKDFIAAKSIKEIEFLDINININKHLR